MADITVRKINESYIAVECADESTAKDLNDYFTFFAPKYQFSPRYKKRDKNGNRQWDGKIRLYSKDTTRLYAGLLRYVFAFLKERNLTIEVKDGLDIMNNFSLEEASGFMKALQLHSGSNPIEAHEHQIIGLAKAIRYKRMLLVSPTASGKSLMMYAITKYLLQRQGGGCKRGLIIVPTINLVAQMYTDFLDYSQNKMEGKVQIIYQGHSTEAVAPVIVSTWQSIYDMPPAWFEQFDFVIGDEAHGFKADSLKRVMTNLVNAKYRIGTTGTLDDWKVHRLVIEGHFGPYSKLVTTKELQDKGLVAQLKTKALILKHKPEDAKALSARAETFRLAENYKAVWKDEMDYLIDNSKRNGFIKNLVKSLKGNRLVLFNYIPHGLALTDLLVDQNNVFLVNGQTEVQMRENVREIAESHNDVVIIASYGVFSTGVNIKNIHHVIFASPSKSKIRVLQSIGRGLRLSEGKDFVTLYDIADDLRHKKWINTSLKHYVERLKIYKDEGWAVSSYLIEL